MKYISSVKEFFDILNENSLNVEIGDEINSIIKKEEFKKWFGNSKVLDDNNQIKKIN
jgi:hypothetical protein